MFRLGVGSVFVALVCVILFQVAKAPAPAAAQDSDDGVDLFGSDDEEECAEAAKIREERLAAYNAKKSKSKCQVLSNILDL